MCSDKLLPCPFCGGDAKVRVGFDVWCEWSTVTVECSKCECRVGPIHPEDKEEAEELCKQWNTRRVTGLVRWLDAEGAKAEAAKETSVVHWMEKEIATLAKCRKMVKKILGQ